VVLSGRYTKGGRGVLRLRGKMSGRDFVREIPVELPEAEARHDVLATLWARARVSDLMSRDYEGLQRNKAHADLRETITQLGLEFRLMTQFTSFVAVEEMTITEGGQPRRVEVPVELPEGVSRAALGGPGARAIVFSGGISSNVGYLSSMNMTVATETVTVTSDGGAGARQSAGTTILDRSIIDPGSVLEGKGVRLKRPGKGKGGGGAGGGSAQPAPTPDPEQERMQKLRALLHPSLFAVVERLGKKEGKPGDAEAGFVRDGKSEVQVWLAEKTPEVVAQLKALGFEVVLDPQSAKLIIGRLPIDKLSALADIKAVRYVAPQT
ncbi:MAG TPA: hypothetical protein VD968_05515, partial [Pyrinomonadaceae bacterium]|nr:hypothetical protein [Pyrinomonadaceae bacterium]